MDVTPVTPVTPLLQARVDAKNAIQAKKAEKAEKVFDLIESNLPRMEACLPAIHSRVISGTFTWKADRACFGDSFGRRPRRRRPADKA